ncbi:hypothetical protein [Streptomyces sclerotialus]|uniref:hypothetical protein n=1 Tax=Streptomyces sclerotialus TaxID=1957 RepID=UPI0004C5C8B6
MEIGANKRIPNISRRGWLGILAVILVLGAAAALVPALTKAGGPSCQAAPASARELAKDPRAATRALDPGQDLARIGRVKKLLGSQEKPLCGGKDGVEVAGRALVAAAAGEGRLHTMPMARVAHAAVMTVGEEYGETDVPDGLKPYLARILAAYIADAHRDITGTTHKTIPAVLSEEAHYEDMHESGNWAAAYPYPGEAHAVFSRRWDSQALTNVVRALASNPESFAVLYDAERAYLAYYLERLDQDAVQPAVHGKKYAPLGTELELKAAGRMIAALMTTRKDLWDRGEPGDLTAFDDAAFKASKGAYRAASHQITTTPAAGTIAARPAVSAHRKYFADGHHQILDLYDRWVDQRHIKPGDAEHYRLVLDEAYNDSRELYEYE